MHESHPEGESLLARNLVSPDELRDVLQRLSGVDQGEIPHPDGYVTAEAIAEATGYTVESIQEILDHLRDQDRQAELARRLRELEEPIYRVERPGIPPNDPLSTYNPMRRTQMMSDLLDSLPHPDRPKVKRKLNIPEDRVSKMLTTVVLAIFVVVFVALSLIAVVQGIRGIR